MASNEALQLFELESVNRDFSTSPSAYYSSFAVICCSHSAENLCAEQLQSFSSPPASCVGRTEPNRLCLIFPTPFDKSLTPVGNRHSLLEDGHRTRKRSLQLALTPAALRRAVFASTPPDLRRRPQPTAFTSMAAQAVTATDYVRTSKDGYSAQYVQLGPLPKIHACLLKMRLSASAQLRFVYVSGRFGIEWTQAEAPPFIRSGTLTFYVNGSVVQEATLHMQNFPPSPAGMLLMDKAHSHPISNVTITLAISSYGALPMVRGNAEIAAEALASKDLLPLLT